VSVIHLGSQTHVVFSVHPEHNLWYREVIYLTYLTGAASVAPFFFIIMCYSDIIPDSRMVRLTLAKTGE